MGRERTVALMAPHLTHIGVHDHGFNNISTYGNLLRLMAEGRIPDNAVGAPLLRTGRSSARARCRRRAGRGRPMAAAIIYSFNGPHSLFVDTIRTLRALAVSHQLGHVLMGENDCGSRCWIAPCSTRSATAKYSVYYGEGRDAYDVRGRVAHESIFNRQRRQLSLPQLAAGLFAVHHLDSRAGLGDVRIRRAAGVLATCGSGDETLEKAARATCDFYIENTPPDGIPYWDTGAPGLAQLGDWRGTPADPFNPHEPVDSSAAAIAAQGLLRLGHFLQGRTIHRSPGSPYATRYSPSRTSARTPRTRA